MMASALTIRKKRFVGLRIKFVVLFVVAAIVIIVSSTCIAWQLERTRAERQMYERASQQAQQMDSVWGFLERNQDQFVKNDDGSYRIYCVVAAKSISRDYTLNTDTVLRYTNAVTRKNADRPDAYELSAIERLRADNSL